VGIVGAGQLGRMLALAGYPLGLRCLFLDRSAESPGGQVAPILVGELEDPARLLELASRSDVVTFDWENISGRALAPLEKITVIRPPRAALETSQDRLLEKALFTRLKIPVAAHAAVDSLEDLRRATRGLGVPGILKTRRMGYDGKGQHVIRRQADLEAAWAGLGGAGRIYEYRSSAHARRPARSSTTPCPRTLMSAAYCATASRRSSIRPSSGWPAAT